jgi:hypothetical protein
MGVREVFVERGKRGCRNWKIFSLNIRDITWNSVDYARIDRKYWAYQELERNQNIFGAGYTNNRQLKIYSGNTK